MKNVLLDDTTYELAVGLAKQRGTSVDEVVADAIRTRVGNGRPADLANRQAIIGSLADQADLLDEIVEGAMRDREALPLRSIDG